MKEISFKNERSQRDTFFVDIMNKHLDKSLKKRKSLRFDLERLEKNVEKVTQNVDFEYVDLKLKLKVFEVEVKKLHIVNMSLQNKNSISKKKLIT